jgi:hypothetical protein
MVMHWADAATASAHFLPNEQALAGHATGLGDHNRTSEPSSALRGRTWPAKHPRICGIEALCNKGKSAIFPLKGQHC